MSGPAVGRNIVGVAGIATLVTLVAALGACRPQVTAPGDGPGPLEIDDADVRVLFVGNSLTYTNGLPRVVEALATAAGYSIAWGSRARANYSLEDHWYSGLEADIRSARADFVVLQQGPSTLTESAIHLNQWTRTIAPVVRESGGEPALFMVWPEESRRNAFASARQSYAAAAAAVAGLFIPAGQTWVEAWALDPTLDFYGPDRFHPSYLGTLAAAQTIVAVLFDLEPNEMPTLDDPITPATLATLHEALEASLAASHAQQSGAPATP